VVEVVIQREVIEYRIVSGTCACGRAQRRTFPAGIEAPVQYGPSGSAFAVYMTQYQLLPYQLPYQCTAEVSNELAGLTISPGTLQHNTVRVAAARLEASVTAIRDVLVAAPVAHAGETSQRVNGTLHGLPVLSTNRLTAYFPHPKRGTRPWMRSAYCPNSWVYWRMTTGQPTSATNVFACLLQCPSSARADRHR